MGHTRGEEPSFSNPGISICNQDTLVSHCRVAFTANKGKLRCMPNNELERLVTHLRDNSSIWLSKFLP